VRFASVQLASSSPFLIPGAASPPADVITPPRRITHPSHGVKTRSLPPLHILIMLRRHLSSRAKIEALNLHYRRRSPSLYRPSLTFHCYKNIISTLATLIITQPHLHFASSLAIAPRHRSFTHHCHSLSPPSHAYHPFT
jgi:hypothetical protein